MTTFATRSFALLALTAIAAQPVLAADLDGKMSSGKGGYGSGGVVAVPAPIPYEETYKWYVRGDLGATLGRNGDVTALGLPQSFSQPDDWGTTGLVSLGFGRYITPSLRTELTLDMRKLRRTDNFTRTTSHTSDEAAVATVGTVTTYGQNTYDVTRTEAIDVRNNTLMLSAFYDLHRGGRIKPYVGAGIGIAMHTLYRNSNENSVCVDGTSRDYNSATGTYTAGPTGCVAGLPNSYVGSATDQFTGFGLAAQLAAGVSIDLSPRVHWDTGYHMIWQQGKVAVSNGSIADFSTIKIGNVINHEVRTGLRWDLW